MFVPNGDHRKITKKSPPFFTLRSIHVHGLLSGFDFFWVVLMICFFSVSLSTRCLLSIETKGKPLIDDGAVKKLAGTVAQRRRDESGKCTNKDSQRTPWGGGVEQRGGRKTSRRTLLPNLPKRAFGTPFIWYFSTPPRV